VTDLLKTIRRRTIGRHFSQSKHRRFIITLEIGDVIGVRLEGTRQCYRYGIESVYQRAILSHLARIDKRARELVKRDGIKMRSAMVKARKELAGDLKP
jgi:hypothetical protein